jgi:outer membrane receptor protein involved in Fe transport
VTPWRIPIRYELNATILKGLEVDAAVRYDNYQGIGSTANPKGSLRWQPYGMDSWNFSITRNLQKKYHDVPSSVTQVPRNVAAYDTLDAQASFLGLKSFKFTVGARNLFDKNPPYANYAASANNFIGGYDISYGDPRGRFVTRASLTLRVEHQAGENDATCCNFGPGAAVLAWHGWFSLP